MKVVLKIVGSMCLLIVFAPNLAAKSWHGITPGRSTREDVARKLRQSVGLEPRFTYRTAGENIEFVFSPAAGYECSKALPSGTVLEIIIHPISQLGLKDIEINKDNLKELTIPGYVINGKAYIDEEEGLVIKTAEGNVREIIYTANNTDRSLCEEYYGSLGRYADAVCGFSCATISVSCPEEVEDGDPVSFSAYVQLGTPVTPLTYTWTVTGGRIVEGQGTDTIKTDSKGLRGKSITATVELGGIDPSCNRSASCTTLVVRKK